MREILFRGKRADNGEWVEGYLYIKYFQELPHDRFVIEYKPNYNSKKWQPQYMIAEIDPETVGQYTGLTDKNGTKIFEGDIILWGLAPCVAKYDIENARFMFYENGKYLKNGFNFETMKMKEVIGNIHDNPELLGGAE